MISAQLKKVILSLSFWRSVVSTVMSGSLFASFPIVDYVPTARAFFLIRHHYSKKVPVEKESFSFFEK